MMHIPAKRNVYLLRLVEDDLGIKVPGIYCTLAKQDLQEIAEKRIIDGL
jgi:hypothetical protein